METVRFLYHHENYVPGDVAEVADDEAERLIRNKRAISTTAKPKKVNAAKKTATKADKGSDKTPAQIHESAGQTPASADNPEDNYGGE